MNHDITNHDRAVLASKTLVTFAREGGCEHPSRMSPVDLQSAIIDLIADLLHFAHVQGFSAPRIAIRASTHFECELREEAPHA